MSDVPPGALLYLPAPPPCDRCRRAGASVDARYDVRTWDGKWLYLCEAHFVTEPSARLGVGCGQRLVFDGEELAEPAPYLTARVE